MNGLKTGTSKELPPLVTTIINNWAKILDDGGPTTVAPTQVIAGRGLFPGLRGSTPMLNNEKVETVPVGVILCNPCRCC